MTHADDPTDDELRGLLARVRTIAVVGYSHSSHRPGHYVAAFLAERGYRVIPVNPGLAGQERLGVRVAARLSEIDEPVDMVDVFRRPEHIPGVVEEALEALPGLSAIWLQLGLRSPEAAEMARARGVSVVQDRCPKIEIPRLFPPGWHRGGAA